VWLLGIFPVWLVGIIDYHGSRIVALERVRWPTTVAVTDVMSRALQREGAPDRLLTDRDPLFRAEAFKVFVATHGVTHTLTKPAHPWTNGRIERLFRTFKETVFRWGFEVAAVRATNNGSRLKKRPITGSYTRAPRCDNLNAASASSPFHCELVYCAEPGCTPLEFASPNGW
jgi:Integrase core domain